MVALVLAVEVLPDLNFRLAPEMRLNEATPVVLVDQDGAVVVDVDHRKQLLVISVGGCGPCESVVPLLSLLLLLLLQNAGLQA